MPKLEPAEWWAVRRAQSRKPASYRCPLCGYQLHAMSAHVLIAPEGDTSRRRHAHPECVAAAFRDGRMRHRPQGPGLLHRIGARLHWPTERP
jgi:hypothetical protein